MLVKGGGLLMIMIVFGVMNVFGVVTFMVKDMVVEIIIYFVIDISDVVMVI